MDINLFNFITAIFVGGAAGYLGSLMITKRMALVGDALGHVALPGMGLALLLGFNVSLGAFVFLLLGVFSVWFLERKSDLPTETLVGVIFVLSLALGFLITPEPELLHALVGDISRVSLLDAVVSVILSVSVLFVVNKIYKKIILASLSEDLAISNKIDIKKNNLIYLLVIAVIVALGVKVVGSLLIGALVIVPAAASRNISRNMRQYVLRAIFLGSLSCVLGIGLFMITGFPVGPLIILTSVFFFIISLIFKK
ncbi:MAG: metal ABC transporter permease [Candidatus Terrybacteria bacterium]|nr:metal ABC transporter permease [Candidatus Terrybacteria bacterium]